ncbi:glutathione S-transferase-like [Ylistrum balloti]|uniref:glutathione S-transferase-like n=1 Tax=Ylistrum balloti TaxID=509963 RepID=UPI002905B257|nr:glutathione S-transferase-like [Ylistrum balloti]
MADNWELMYWPLAGRGEFIRVIFVEAGIEFKDTDDSKVITEKVKEGKMEGFPVKFPPVLCNGDFHLSQTPTICKYLGKKFGLYPDNEDDEWHADQLNATIHDYIAEGRLSFHGVNHIMTYFNQIEETKPYIERFVTERMPMWLKYFEKVLLANNGGTGFMFGNKLTYVDLGLMHVLRATESQFPDAWNDADYIPTLKSFKDRMCSRPRLAAYFKSDKCRPFEGNSMM